MLIGGLDVGTTGCKLTVYNDNGRFIHNEYIEYEVKRQNGEHEIDADSPGDGLLGHNRAYLDWIQNIMVKYSQLIIENCSSGGMRMDYAMFSMHPIQSVTDQSDCINMVPIAAGAATAVLPEQAAIWSYPVSEEEPNITAINMVNSMLLRMHLSGEVMNLSEEQKSLVIDGVKKYKEIREYITGAIPFYPLGLPKYHGEWQCVGYKTDNKVFLAVWRMDSEQSEIKLPLKANKASVVYGFKDVGQCTIHCDNVLIYINQKNNAIIIELDV